VGWELLKTAERHFKRALETNVCDLSHIWRDDWRARTEQQVD